MAHSRGVPRTDWRLGLDVAPLRRRPAGVGIYVLNLARAIAREMPGRLVLLGRRREAWSAEALLAELTGTEFSHRHYHAWMQLAAPRATRRSAVHLAHFTNAAAPLLGGRPYVLTVHDLSMPRTHPLARLATIPVSLAAVAAARRIIVPSQATGEELCRLLRVDARRISIVPHAASGVVDEGSQLEATVQKAGAGDASVTLQRLGLRPAGYLLALGTIEPRKNHLRLLEAFEQLVGAGHDLRLVIVGELGWHAGALLRRIEASPQRARILRPGYVDETDLRALLEHSAAVAYVSLYEGYGLPVIEAMAAGAAVVTSSVSSMPEVAGDAAVLVDPRDVGAISRGIEEALQRRSELRAAGLARAQQRTWTDVARETIAVYEEAISD
jgi:glycosyltransferase involved in cell wall biosynthesis